MTLKKNELLKLLRRSQIWLGKVDKWAWRNHLLEDWNSIFRNIASLDTFAQNMIQSLYHHIKTDKVDKLSITVIMILTEYEIN